MVDYTIHRFAEFLPLPEEGSQETIRLQDSLQENGMLTPVLLFQDRILDGRRRYMAHKKFPTIELRTELFEGTEEEALERAVSLNSDRRELNTSQRALLAWNYTREQRKVSVKEAKGLAQARFLVSSDLIELVGAIVNSKDHDQADKDKLITAIGQGFPVKPAYHIMKTLPAVAWSNAVSDGDGTIARGLLKTSRKRVLEAKKELKETQARNEAIKTVNTAIANGGEASYQLLLVDLPNNSIDGLQDMAIPATDNCIMLFWTNLYQLAQKIAMMEDWGFDYKHAYVVNNTATRQVDLLLFGAKGEELPAIKEAMPFHQTVNVKEGRAPAIKTGITKMFPDLIKFDMFGNGKNSEGWMHGGIKAKAKRNGKAATEEQPTA